MRAVIGRAQIKFRAQVVSSCIYAHVPYWLIHLGALGLFSVAAVDSSVISVIVPGGTDLLLLWLVANGGEPWSLAASAIAGSLLGGYSTWELGRRGGKAALSHYIPALMLRRIVRWVEHHPVLAVFVPAVLPPPIPSSPFILASGALSVSRGRFLVNFASARILRYSLVAMLGVRYGKTIVGFGPRYLDEWSVPLLWAFGCLVVVSICVGIWKVLGMHRFDVAQRLALQAAAGRSE